MLQGDALPLQPLRLSYICYNKARYTCALAMNLTAKVGSAASVRVSRAPPTDFRIELFLCFFLTPSRCLRERSSESPQANVSMGKQRHLEFRRRF